MKGRKYLRREEKCKCVGKSIGLRVKVVGEFCCGVEGLVDDGAGNVCEPRLLVLG